MDFQRELKRYRPYLPLLFLVIAFVVGYFLAKPAVSSLWSQYQKNQQKEEVVSREKEDLEILQELEERYQEVMKELEKTDIILPNEKKLTQVLFQAEALAQENGLILTSLGLPSSSSQQGSPGPEEQEPVSASAEVALTVEPEERSAGVEQVEPVSAPVAETSFQGPGSDRSLKKFSTSLSLTGSYENFKDFLQEVEKNLRLMDVVSLDLNPPQEGGSLYQFKLKVRLYYYE